MGVVKAASTVGIFTLLSRFAGYVREVFMACWLGAGVCTDAFLIALRLANTFRRIFAEGAFSVSFVPRFSKILAQEGHESANKTLSGIFTLMLIILSIFTAIVIIFFPQVLSILVSGFDSLSYKFGLSVSLGRICFIYLIFISLTSLWGGVLNALNKFALTAAVYSLLSIFVIIGLFVGHLINLSSESMVYLISFCVVISGIFQSYILYSSVKKQGFCINLRFDFDSRPIRDIMKNMVPGIFAAGIWQLNLIVDMSICSYLPTGSITCINLADRLNQFPLGTLGIALSTALLPILSGLIAKKKYESARNELQRGLLFGFFLTFFATSVLVALDVPSVSVAFQRGEFGEEQVQITARALVGFAIGLPAYVLTKFFSTVYFASGDIKTPVKFGIIAVALNVVFLVLLVPFLKYFGLALCISISSLSNATLLIYFLKKELRPKLSREFFCKIGSQFCAAIVTYNVLVWLKEIFWIGNIGEEKVKWFVYFAFLGAAILVFFLTTVAGLCFTKQSQWKLWKREAW